MAILAHYIANDPNTDPQEYVVIIKNDRQTNSTPNPTLLSQLQQSKDPDTLNRMASSIAHDFNNLLTVIYGYTSILLSQIPEGSPYIPSLEEIKKASQRASTLTRQLLAFSRKQLLEPQTLDLNLLITKFEKLLHRVLCENIQLVTHTSPALGKIQADPKLIEQILLNLILNARDAMPHGGTITITTNNVVCSQEYARQHSVLPGPYVMITVSDTGTGIAPDIQAHIFEPFFTTKTRTTGTGLGLSSVYGMITQSNGAISFNSQMHHGTTFQICLPRTDQPTEANNQHEISQSLSPNPAAILPTQNQGQPETILAHTIDGYRFHEATEIPDPPDTFPYDKPLSSH